MRTALQGGKALVRAWFRVNNSPASDRGAPQKGIRPQRTTPACHYDDEAGRQGPRCPRTPLEGRKARGRVGKAETKSSDTTSTTANAHGAAEMGTLVKQVCLEERSCVNVPYAGMP